MRASIAARFVSHSGGDQKTQLRFSVCGSGATREKVVITEDGHMGIGTMTPQTQLHVYGGASTSIRSSGGSNNNKKVEIGYDNSAGPYIKGGSSGEVGIKLYYDNTTLGAKLHTDGDWYTNDGSVSSISDSRVKDSVANLTDGINLVKQLRPVTYKYNSKSEFYSSIEDTTTRYGFVADEVKVVAPQYTTTGKGKIDGVEVDDLKSLSITKMIPMLVKAIQELEARLKTLEDA
jgi:hypothetical protein